MTRPLIALVGRPNVGKSTLFNRLIGERRAIVEDMPGTTRDRLYGVFEWRGLELAVVDTGGLVPDSEEEIGADIFRHAEMAIEQSDLVVLVVDSRTGLTPVDVEIANLVRRSEKPTVLAVNKVDNVRQELMTAEFHALGLGEPTPVSAERGLNTGDLLDRIFESLPEHGDEEDTIEMASIAIVGRPNVGKSSLLNALVGSERALVSPIAGTTRDTVDTELLYKDEPLRLIDTAGIRPRGKVSMGIERFSVLRALRAIDRADVAVLVVDATEPLAAQDAHIAGYVQDEVKGLVVAVNKWDLIEKGPRTSQEYERAVREELKFMPYVPLVFISSKTGQRIQQVLDMALSVRRERQKRISTGELNQTVRKATSDYPPPSSRGKLIKVFYVTQVGIDPPTFVAKVNDPSAVHFGYRRFLENRIRDQFGFFGTPIRIYFRGRDRNAA